MHFYNKENNVAEENIVVAAVDSEDTDSKNAGGSICWGMRTAEMGRHGRKGHSCYCSCRNFEV